MLTHHNIQEAAVREVLGEDEPVWPPGIILAPNVKDSSASIARSSSFYSLPEFLVEEDEEEGRMVILGWSERKEADGDDDALQPSTSTTSTRV